VQLSSFEEPPPPYLQNICTGQTLLFSPKVQTSFMDGPLVARFIFVYKVQMYYIYKSEVAEIKLIKSVIIIQILA